MPLTSRTRTGWIRTSVKSRLMRWEGQRLRTARGGIPECAGLGRVENFPWNRLPWGPGVILKDRFLPSRCDKVANKTDCLEQCLLNVFKQPAPLYNLLNLGKGINCQAWADGALS